MANVFLIHWDKAEAQEASRKLQERGFRVYYEAWDINRAFKLVHKQKPDVVVIYLRRRPSHGIRAAASIRGSRASSRIPIVFVDGSEDAVQQAQENVNDAYFVDEGQLAETLDWLVKEG